MTGGTFWLTGILDVAGIAVFAMSGALMAARARQTMVTFAFFAAVTGMGGGTVRDLLIGAPVFWMHEPIWIATCLSVAVLVWFLPNRMWPVRAVEWCDAVGLAAYSVYGAAKALQYGIPPLPAAVMGVVTACLGGIFRDVLAGVPSIVIRPEIYVTAAAAAAAGFVVLVWAGLPMIVAALIAAPAGFALRALAIARGLALPAYRR
ncbi:trimeric intracellular cation channel family protein [Falsirhodobacter algicola]|uniref:Trimeric intracellular cation channel family protein n=1 Tax=Falsirhodobacter algicola TaxID=2692330 RepID=A0A8J8SLM1_9RHOB|nr:trimeric intracellular cation channel family protein [Falsirhodobacter algicola]QUS37210.1 trimeric intracellular cation channel family protein [Falsirhodobacter algicola]